MHKIHINHAYQEHFNCRIIDRHQEMDGNYDDNCTPLVLYVFGYTMDEEGY